MSDLQAIRADPSILEKEKQAHYLYYNSRWDCCKDWRNFRCQYYPPTPEHPGVDSIRLEGYFLTAPGCPVALPSGGTGEVIKKSVRPPPPGIVPLPPGGTGEFLKKIQP
jgi:hypothetical protein